MRHLTESLLNEYLDETLDDEARCEAEAHLASCADCQAKANTLRRTFDVLAALPEEPLGHDLSRDVLARIPAQHNPRIWRLALGAQAAAAGILLAFGYATLAKAAAHFADEAIGVILPSTARLIQTITHAWAVMIRPLSFDLSWSFNMPDFPTMGWLALIISAGVLWLVGNTLLILPRKSN